MNRTHRKNKKGVAFDMYGGGEVQTGCSWGNLWEREHLEDLGDRRIVLKWVLSNSFGRVWTGLTGSIL